MTCCFYQHLNLFPRLSLNYYRPSLSYQISTKKCGQILILHLSRYLDSSNNVFIKNTDFVECLPETTHVSRVSIQTGDSISFTYSLIATINHSGTLQAGHYWEFIKDCSKNNWLKCNDNDRAVLKVKTHTLNNNTSYVLFYIKN